MNFFITLLNNTWVVSITAPIIVTFIVYQIKKSFSKFSKNKTIESSRNSIVSFLEKLVTNGTKLDKKKMTMIVSSFVRKYHIEKKYVSEKSVLEDLLVKVYAIDYIQLKQRETILDDLEAMHQDYSKPILNSSSVTSSVKSDKSYSVISHSISTKKNKNTLINLLQIYLSILSILSVTTLFLPLFLQGKSNHELLKFLFYPFNENDTATFISINIFLLAFVLITILVSYVIINVRWNRRR